MSFQFHRKIEEIKMKRISLNAVSINLNGFIIHLLESVIQVHCEIGVIKNEIDITVKKRCMKGLI